MVAATSNLKERLASEMKDALKGGEKLRLGALRMLAAAVKNREVEVGHELSDDEVMQVAAREVKRRGESIEAFEQAGRDDLVAKEREEREILRAYAPEMLSPEDVEALIDEAVAATGAASPAEMGKVMGMIMGKAKGRVDGAAVQAMVKKRLGG